MRNESNEDMPYRGNRTKTVIVLALLVAIVFLFAMHRHNSESFDLNMSATEAEGRINDCLAKTARSLKNNVDAELASEFYFGSLTEDEMVEVLHERFLTPALVELETNDNLNQTNIIGVWGIAQGCWHRLK